MYVMCVSNCATLCYEEGGFVELHVVLFIPATRLL